MREFWKFSFFGPLWGLEPSCFLPFLVKMAGSRPRNGAKNKKNKNSHITFLELIKMKLCSKHQPSSLNIGREKWGGWYFSERCHFVDFCKNYNFRLSYLAENSKFYKILYNFRKTSYKDATCQISTSLVLQISKETHFYVEIGHFCCLFSYIFNWVFPGFSSY